MTYRATSLTLFFMILLFGCGLGASDTTLEDKADLCVYPANGGPANIFAPPTQDPRDYPADRPVQIVVKFNGCLSASCDTQRSATCSASMSGDTITVTSDLSWHNTGDNACTEDCGLLSTTCMTDPLPAGNYTIVHGAGRGTLQIGGVSAPLCVTQ